MSKLINSKDFDKLVRESKGFVLVDFYADWCGPCRMLGPIMDEVSESNTVYKVNVDDNQELAMEFGIMYIPCVICFKDGKEYKRLIGLRSKEDILDMLK